MKCTHNSTHFKKLSSTWDIYNESTNPSPKILCESPPGGRKLSQALEAKTRRSLAENATRLRIVPHLGLAFFVGGWYTYTPEIYITYIDTNTAILGFFKVFFWGGYGGLISQPESWEKIPSKKPPSMLTCEFRQRQKKSGNFQGSGIKKITTPVDTWRLSQVPGANSQTWFFTLLLLVKKRRSLVKQWRWWLHIGFDIEVVLIHFLCYIHAYIYTRIWYMSM